LENSVLQYRYTTLQPPENKQEPGFLAFKVPNSINDHRPPDKIFSHHAIDKSKWDDCIRVAPNGLVYARSFYLDTMAKNWNALY